MKISIIYHSKTGNTQKMAELVSEGCLKLKGIEVKTMLVDDMDSSYMTDSKAIIFGSPTYAGTCSWQIKKFFDTCPVGLSGKLGGVFVSQNWPGGGASFAEMNIIAAMLVHGMIVYSGGVTSGPPYLHFGAVSRKAPDNDLYRERCIKLGENISQKAIDLFEHN